MATRSSYLSDLYAFDQSILYQVDMLASTIREREVKAKPSEGSGETVAQPDLDPGRAENRLAKSIGQQTINSKNSKRHRRENAAEGQPGKGRRQQERTPAMALGLTDRICRLEALLLIQVPPWSQARAQLGG